MTNRKLKKFTTLFIGLILGVATGLSASGQTPMQTLCGVIRVPKDFGIAPAGPGLNEAAALPCPPYPLEAPFLFRK